MSRPIPIYPSVAGLESWKIQNAVRTVLEDTSYASSARALADRIHSRRAQPLDTVTHLLARTATARGREARTRVDTSSP